MENKLTALDWVIKQINNKSIGDRDYRTISDVFKQAKQMEKEQIIDAYNYGYLDYQILAHDNAEEYYELNFGH
jgi:IS1 family transposase